MNRSSNPVVTQRVPYTEVLPSDASTAKRRCTWRGLCCLSKVSPSIAINSDKQGPPGQRRYTYEPTYLLRGLTELYIDYTPTP